MKAENAIRDKLIEMAPAVFDDLKTSAAIARSIRNQLDRAHAADSD